MKLILLVSGLLCIQLLNYNNANAQCATPPAPGVCSGGDGAASNGQNINGGQLYWYNNTGTFTSGVNLNGGKLTICGNLTLNSINFNSGTIEILAGGTLTISSAGSIFLNGNSTIINRGTLNSSAEITMQNSNNYFYNLVGATLNMPGRKLEVNSSSSFFINNGTASIGTLHMQSQAVVGAVCLGLNSIMNLTNFVANSANCITAPSGPACISYTGSGQLNQNLSATANVKVCRSSSSTTSGGSGFGAAVVTANCSGCSVVLPPANDNCSSSIPLTINAAPTGGTLANATPQAGGFSQVDVWYRFTPGCTLNHTITLENFTGANLDFAVYNSGCPANPSAGLMLTQSIGGTGIAEINTSNFISGTTYYVRVFITSGTAPSFTIRVQGFAPAQPGIFTSGNATPCAGTANTYAVAAVANATSYNWAYPAGWSGSSTTNAISATASATAGNVSVTATNCYGTSTASTFAVVPNTVPAQPGLITTPATLCAAATNNVYSIAAVANATSYTWVYPTGWVGGSTGLSNTLTAGSSGNISVTATNSCGNSTARVIAVAPLALPANPTGSIAGITPNCNATDLNYSNPSSNIYWQTTATGTSTVTSTLSSLNVTISGNYFVRSFNGNCWSAASSAAFPVSIIPSRAIFRSVASGNWSTVANWEMSNDGLAFVPACNYPVANNSNEVIIQNLHKITVNLNIDIDKVTVNVGGELEIGLLNKLTLTNVNAGADMIVNGTLTDRVASGNAIEYALGATWQLGVAGSVIKTNQADAINYRDNYHTGIANMVDGSSGAKFVFRYNGDGNTALVSMDMYYPNVYFENTTALPYNFNATTKSVIEGNTTSVCIIKGSLFIGSTGTSAVTVYNNGENATNLFTIFGNLTIANNSTLTNQSFNGSSPVGTGFDVKGNIIVDGVFTVRNNDMGALKLTGTAAQNISGNNVTPNNMNVHDCIVTNIVAVTINKDFNIFGEHTYTSNAKLTFGLGNITLKSIATSTATVTAIPTNCILNYTGAGRYIVERFITAGRKWRFLSVPASTTQSVRQSWMENAANEAQNLAPGYGMIVTDEMPTAMAQGFDFRSISGPSVKAHNAASNNYMGIVSPSTLLSSNSAYMVYVRGDRTCKPVPASTIANTTLRVKGQLYRNIQSTSAILSGQYKAIGNPFAARLDLRTVYTNSTISSIFYLWDSKLVGAYGIGAFQTLTYIGGNFKITPGGGSYPASGSNMNTLESGQAFFARAAATIGTLNINETDKIAGSTSNVFRTNAYDPSQLFSATLRLKANNDSTIVDGVMLHFNNNANNNIDFDDAEKLQNLNENIAIKKEGKLLAVEQKQPTTLVDTIQLNIMGLRSATYQWQLTTQNFCPEGRTAFLIDKFLNTSNPINLHDDNFVDFVVNTNPASYQADRFMIIFKQAPVTNFIHIAAERNTANANLLVWKINNEWNINNYQLQLSDDGVNFAQLATILPIANNGSHPTYTYTHQPADSKAKWYRVKATNSQTTIPKYSPVAMINGLPAYTQILSKQIVIAPNPIENNQANILFTNQALGNYLITIVNPTGQVILQQSITILSPWQRVKVQLPNIAEAIYQAIIVNEKGEKQIIPFTYK